MTLALDFANYTPVPTPATVACWRQQGYTRAIIGASYGSVAKRQILACQQGGMEVEAFAWTAFSGNWRLPLDRAVAVCRDTAVKRIWTDAEDQPTGDFAATVRRIAEAVAYIESFGFKTGIYTGGWWWKPKTNDSHHFLHLPLWTGEYPNNPSDPPAGKPTLYGGWTRAAMWQYAGSVPTCGLNTDRNVILEAETPPAIGEDDMKLVWDVERRRVYLYGPRTMRWVTIPQEAQGLEALLGPAKAISPAANIDYLGLSAAIERGDIKP